MQPMAPPPQGPYPQQPHAQGPYPQQPYPQQGAPYPMQHGQAPYPQPYGMQPQGPRRNVALLVVGGVLLLVATGAFMLFAYNAWQYMTVEDRFADIAGSEFVVEIVKKADMRRMMVFGPVSAIFGFGGLLCGFLGFRKK